MPNFYGSTFFVAVGGLTLAWIGYNVIRVLLSIFVLPGKSFSSFGPRGSWALITGASDGIGKEYALQLSRKGFNILLVSRTQSKLDAVSSAITTSNSSIRVETLAMDFAANLDSDYARLSTLIKEKDISVLVNNVGQSHDIPVPFSETPEKEINNIITINCTGTLRVTQLVIPGMIQRKRGLVLTMGSFGGLVPTPYLATYSGSKAFLQQWSSALASELAPAGITVHLVHSYLVTSAMSKIKRSSMVVPSEKQFVRSALSKVGRRGGSLGYAFSGSPYWSHALAASVFIGVLGAYGEMLLDLNRNMHVQIRKKALRKQEKELKKVK